MLENMRKSGSSVLVWIIFAILIVVFVFSFGPQAGGSQGGCSSGERRTALTVGDSDVDDNGFRLAVNIASGLVPSADDFARYEVTLELLIRRELLAQEAERRGLRVPESLVDHVISRGELHFAGEPRDQYRQVFMNEDEVFDYKRFKRFLQNWGLSVAAYKRQQSREVLASTMSRILTGSVPVSREEALGQFVAARTTVTFEAVRFDPRRYADALLVTDADVDRYVLAHEAEVKATYSDALYKGKKQVHVRRIRLAKTAPKADAAPPADPAAPLPPGGAGTPADPAAAAATKPPAADPARAKLEALRADIVAGRKSFADAARTADADEPVRARGGAWGWYDEGALTLPEPALNDAVKALVAKADPAIKPGASLSPVVEASDGFYLLTVDDRRAGDLTFDQVKRELGERLARDAWGLEAARRAAIEALATARAGTGKSLRELFPGAKTGQTVWESDDSPAAWTQDPAGTGAGTAAATPAAPVAVKPDLLKPSSEQLPAIGKLDPPTAESFGPLSRSKRTPLGESDELNRALFDELASGMIAPTIFEVRETKTSPSPKFAVIQMTNKELADVAEFEKQADAYIASLAKQRGGELLRAWLAERCTALAARGKIKPAAEFINRKDEQGNALKVTYKPCMTLLPPPAQ